VTVGGLIGLVLSFIAVTCFIAAISKDATGWSWRKAFGYAFLLYGICVAIVGVLLGVTLLLMKLDQPL